MEAIGGDGSETELDMKKKGKHKSTTGIGASLTRDYREKEESSNRPMFDVDVTPHLFSVKKITDDLCCSVFCFEQSSHKERKTNS